MIYHFVIDGAAFVTLPDGESIELGPGDIVVLPHGDPHVMTSARGFTGDVLTSAIISKIKARDLRPMQAGQKDLQVVQGAKWMHSPRF